MLKRRNERIADINSDLQTHSDLVPMIESFEWNENCCWIQLKDGSDPVEFIRAMEPHVGSYQRITLTID